MTGILYEHNRIAYQNACAMLREKGRAAVIHPTGTGKSFIAFQLVADHPDKTICWLSPSEYIFRTQLENWEAANRQKDIGTEKDAGNIRGNIRFLTYARLMLMQQGELEELKPDYIILDEFHRCGARMWGEGVQRLLSLYAGVPVLGLSATSIRYLDSQRDMAQELFDGNVASEMSLGESIVRGILNPPKYVLSVFAYQKELERYEERVRRAKSKAVRDQAWKYLEALRRALENADGIDEVFYKNIEEKAGRYLVFCADYEHMHEMIAKVPEWFGKVDCNPHVYSVYSEDPQSEQSFAEFKADESSHLKLLFCIDMLNEGIHVDDVSGVVLLRPTISPIIYKQQIGRALSAGKKKSAVIFDVVMNIENLYSIGTLEEEMQTIVRYYRASGLDREIVNEHFRVTGEILDCVQLFRKLEESLGTSWELMYSAAKEYYDRYGDLEVPKRFKTAEGFSLGQWLDTQRKVRAGKVSGHLTDAQVERLDLLHMRWQGRSDQLWEKNYAAARQYYKEHGHLLVSAGEECGGVKLGKWIARLREEKKNLGCPDQGNAAQTSAQKAEDGQPEAASALRAGTLTEERVRALEAIGMVWDVPDYRWEQNFCAAQRYYREHGNLDVPYYYTDQNGVRLGAWICSMRSVRKESDRKRAELSEKQIRRLDEIGMVWQPSWDKTWERSYGAACRYREEHGNLDIPTAYVTKDGLRLGRWIRHQRDACRGNISEERKRKLEKLGI